MVYASKKNDDGTSEIVGEFHHSDIDKDLEELALAWHDAREWAKKNNKSDVHIMKTHYRDLRDGVWKDCWNLVWDNDDDRIAFMDECTSKLFQEVEESKESIAPLVSSWREPSLLELM